MIKKQKLYTGREKVVDALLKTYDIRSAEDIQEALKDLLGDTVRS